ncbi:lytic transglycosylase [Candidatus Epulonipiscioides gigas]|nr:lytic transglycosylase [Epulopiscium sp. SCG-C07WGA-EpuloA2]
MINKTKCKFIVGIGLLVGIISAIFTAYKLYPRPHFEYVKDVANLYDLDPLLIYSIIQTETHFDHLAVSRSGASGFMQIMEPTGRWIATELEIEDYEKKDLFNPYINIRMGSWYIARLIKNYKGNLNTALMAYNAGSGNVAKWLGDTRYSNDGKIIHTIPFKETKEYVEKVNFHYFVYDFLY